MVDNFSIALSHLLLAVMLWRLFNSPALDDDERANDAASAKLKTSMKDDQRSA